MNKAVNNTMPSQKQIEKAVNEVKGATDAVNKYVLNLTPNEKRRSAKPRRGGDKISELIARVAIDWKLAVTGVTPGEIVAHRDRAMRLRPLQEASLALARSLGDAIYDAESKAWSATTSVYSVLKNVARKDGALRAELAPAMEFFSTGKRKPKTPPAPKTTPTP